MAGERFYDILYYRFGGLAVLGIAYVAVSAFAKGDGKASRHEPGGVHGDDTPPGPHHDSHGGGADGDGDD